MADYGVKYRFRWSDDQGADWKVDISQDGYTGSVLQRAIGASSVSLRRDRNGNICGTSLELAAECVVDEEFAELYTTNPYEFKVEVFCNGTSLWLGFITPELYSEPFIAPPYDVQVTASDNLGELKRYKWGTAGRLTLANMLATLLSPTGLSLAQRYVSKMATSSLSASSFFQGVSLDLDELEGETYYDVLDNLLSTLHAVIFQQGGCWVIMRETDITSSISSDSVVPAGELTGYPISSIGSAYAGGLWPEGHVDLTVEPAHNSISLVCSELWKRYGAVTIDNGQAGNPQNFRNATLALSATFSASDGISLHEGTNTERFPLSVVVDCAKVFGADRVIDGPFGAYDVFFTVQVAVTGNGVTRYLAESKGNSDAGKYIWKSSRSSINIALDSNTYYRPEAYGVSESTTGEVIAIDLPDCEDITALTRISVTYTGSKTPVPSGIVNYKPAVHFYDAWLSFTNQFDSLMDTVSISNNARGPASDVKVIVSGATNVALEKYFISNTLLVSGALIGQVHSDNFSGYDFISFLSRDYALSIAAPRLRAEGVLFGYNAPVILPLFVSMGGVRYAMETWDWNLVSGGIDFSALSLPAVSVTVTSEEIVTGDGLSNSPSSGGGYSGGGSGGSSSSGGSGYIPSGAFPTMSEWYIGTTKAQASATEDQDLTGIGNATLSGKLNLPQGAYLEVVNVGTTANPVYAIHTNIGLYSDSFVSAFGASDTGGGGGGIDLSAMWANLQVNESGTTGYNLQINPGHLTTALGTYVNAITTTGSGNAITAVSKSGSTLTFTKGSTFALASRTVTGTGYLTGGGALSANRTIDIASTYKGYIDEGHTAYGWGDHSQAGYLTGITSSMVTTALGFTPANSTALGNYLPLTGGTLTGHLYLSSAQIYIKNSDSAILSGTTSTSSAAGTSMIGQARGTTTIRGFDDPIWRRYTNNGQYTDYTIYHSGNLTQSVVTGLIGSSTYAPYNADGYLPLSGGTMTGNLVLSNAVYLAVKDSGGTVRTAFGINSSNNLLIGYATAGQGYETHIYGGSIDFHYGTARTVGMTLTSAGALVTTGNIILPNAVALQAYDTNGTAIGLINMGGSNQLRVGYQSAGTGYDSFLHGNNVYLTYGTSRTTGLTLNSSGNVTIAGVTTMPKLRITTKHSATNTSGGIYYYNGSTDYLLIGQGTSNLWIGANETAGTHHTGSTYISGGDGNVYFSRLVNSTRTNYLALDAGNYSSYALPLSGGTMTGSPVLSNAVAIKGLDSGGTERTLLSLDASNYVSLAYGAAGAGYTTNVYGNIINLKYGTSHTTGFTLDSSGNVGIGTTTPANKLHVSGGGRFDSNANIWSTISGAQINFNKLSTYTTGYNQGIRFRIADSSNTEISSKYLLGVYSGSAYGYMYLGGTYSDATVRITDTGVGIKKGNANPSYALDVTGSIRATERVVATTGFGTINTPASANVTSPGWYRIWSSNVKDIQGNNIILFINREYGSGTPENFAFEINIEGNGAISITQLSGNRQSTSYKYLTKLRVVWAYNTANSVFIDFYYAGSVSNPIRVHGYAGKGQFQPAAAVTDTPAHAVEFDLLQDTFKTSKNIVAMGYISAFGVSSTSDARLKKDFRDTTLTVDDIAHAPAITFLWKDREGKRQAGSLAQYWETVLPEVVTDIEGKKGLDYGAAALVSAITIARDVNDHEKRIRELERENRELKRRLGYAME